MARAKTYELDIPHLSRSNCDRYLTESDQVIIRTLISRDNRSGAMKYIKKCTLVPLHSEDHVIRELQDTPSGALPNEIDPEKKVFYPNMG